MKVHADVVVDLEGFVCWRCGLAPQWLEHEDLTASQRGRLPELPVQLVDELGLLVALCLCGHTWWIGPLL